MADILFQYTFFGILFISLLIAVGLGALYSAYVNRDKVYPSASCRRRAVSFIGVVLLILGVSCFAGMLLLRLKRDGTLLNVWTFGFVIGFVLETCFLIGIGYYAVNRSRRKFLERNGGPPQ